MPVLNSVFNYLVPASGNTNAYVLDKPQATDVFDCGKISSETGQMFVPSGVLINNLNGSNTAIITIHPIGFQIVCSGGGLMGLQYPAMEGHTATFEGCEDAQVTFVDFPVIPYLFFP